MNIQQADSVMSSVSDLVNPAYKPKYYKALYRLGPDRFLALADRARTGKFPQHLFRHLIDEATK